MSRFRGPLSIVVAVAVMASAFVIVRAFADGPDDVVRAFLEAAQRADVDKAVEAAGTDQRPADVSAAIASTEWTLGKVSRPYHEFGDDAEVSATITDGSLTAGGHFELHKSDGRWRITNPYATVEFPPSPVRIPASYAGMQHVLPGFYVQAAAGLVRATNEAHLAAIPNSYDWTLRPAPNFLPTPAARQRFQQLSDAYVDKCLTDSSCLPEDYSGIYANAPGLRKATWRVVRYPAVDLPGGLTTTTDSQAAFTGQIMVPGVLHVTGLTKNGKAFTSNCWFDNSRYFLNAWVDTTGALQAGWGRKPEGIRVGCRADR